MQNTLKKFMCMALFGAACMGVTGCGDDDGESKSKPSPDMNMQLDMPEDLPPSDDMDMYMAPDCGLISDMGNPDAGCGSRPDMPPDTDMQEDMPSAEPTIDEALAEVTSLFVKALCDQAFECPERAGELFFVLGRYPNKQSCYNSELLRALFMAEGMDETKASVAAGRQIYDKSKARACLDAFARRLGQDVCAGIDDSGSQPPECADVFVGAVPSGGNCLNWEDCAKAGDLCVPGDDPDLCYGVCQAASSNYNTCNGATCAANEYCDYNNDSGSPACAPKSAVGAVCDEFDACQGDAICDIDYANPDANGQYVGMCKARGSVAAGGECFEDAVCARGTRCDSDLAKCVTPVFKQSGQDCTFPDDQCAPGLTCAGLVLSGARVVGKCAPAKGEGGECALFTECLPDLQCEGGNLMTGAKGQCKPLRAAGANCATDAECQSFRCVDDKCAAPEPACMVP
jgi:hypothetical protein